METVTDKNTVTEIKAYLDAQGIEYPTNATKSDLLSLLPVDDVGTNAEVEETTNSENPTSDSSADGSSYETVSDGSSNVLDETTPDSEYDDSYSQPADWVSVLMPQRETEPEPEPLPEDTYTVQEGDTLASIANSHNTSIGKLRKLNGFVNPILFVGRVVLIR